MLKKIVAASAVSLFAASAMAASCDITITGTDQMVYAQGGKEITEIVVPASCQDFTIHLNHGGKMPVTAMGHNVVIAKAADISGVADDGMRAGAKNGYLKPNDARVLAYSEMVGAGGKTSVSFPVARIKDGAYDFFCSFPGHQIKMRGQLIVQ
ncbi:MAG: azurin [Neisseria sp.]|nr:azurin [Neisseria sp.]